MTCDQLIKLCEAKKAGKVIQFKNCGDLNWIVSDFPHCFDPMRGQYRIKPEPKRVPLSFNDIPPVCWIKKSVDVFRLVVETTVFGVRMGTLGGELTFVDMAKQGWQYSTDRKNWKPCWKEQTE